MQKSFTKQDPTSTEEVSALCDFMLTHITPIFNDFIQHLPDHLLDKAETLNTGSASIGLLRSADTLTSHQPKICETFFTDLKKGFDILLDDISEKPSDWRENHLDLLCYADLEEQTALSPIIDQADSINAHQLWSLSQRVSLLTGGRKLTENQLPFTPSRFCLAMQHSFEQIEIPIQARLEAFHLFDKLFITKLDGVYKTLNHHLQALGLLPNLRYAATLEDQNNHLDDTTNSTALTERSIREILDSFNHQTPSGISQSTRDGYTLELLTNTLEKLQARSADTLRASSTVPTTIKTSDHNSQLFDGLAECTPITSPQQLSQDDQMALELTNHLFTVLHKDEQLPKAIKSYLSYFWPPLLMTALQEEDFFESTNHPVWVLINQIADAGLQWVDNNDKAEYGALDVIHKTVLHVISSAKPSRAIYDQTNRELSSYIKKVAMKVSLLEKRAAEKARGENTLKQAKLRAHQEIKQRIDGIELPSAILLLLLQPWPDYMTFLLLRYGDKSEQWQQSLDLVDDLIWGLQLEDTLENKLSWRQNYTWVEATLARGFETIGYNAGKAKKLKHAIDKVYKENYQNQTVNTPEELRKKLINLADQRAGTLPITLESLSAKQLPLVTELLTLKPGTWFEHVDGHREKLTWLSNVSLEFLFADQSGKQTGIKHATELAEAILNKQLKILPTNQQSLVERSFNYIQTSYSGKA